MTSRTVQNPERRHKRVPNLACNKAGFFRVCVVCPELALVREADLTANQDHDYSFGENTGAV